MGAKVLLVNDDKDMRDSVQETLKSNSDLIVEATDCETAISLLARQTFDLILIDITLPDKSGFRVLEFLQESHLANKVIVITGTLGLWYENAIKSAIPGVKDYITKPYNPKYLLRSIEHILSIQSQTNLRLQIIKAGDFIKSTPTGNLDMKASKQGFAQIAAAGSDLQDYTVLIDLRDVKSRLSTTDVYELASELAQYGETFQRKTAMLVRDDEGIDQAMFFETAANNRGFEVRVFTVFEDAITWLSSITQPIEDQIK